MLVEQGLVSVSGRHRYFTLATVEVAQALEASLAIARPVPGGCSRVKPSTSFGWPAPTPAWSGTCTSTPLGDRLDGGGATVLVELESG